MIRTFRHKGLKDFWLTGSTKGVPAHLAKKIDSRLAIIDDAQTIEDIDYPGLDLHELKGDRKGTWAVKVSGNWRITFQFFDGDAWDLNLEDYH